MRTNRPAQPAGYVSIAEAAQILGVTPWDVVRLINDRRIETAHLVSVDSLQRHQAQGAA